MHSTLTAIQAQLNSIISQLQSHIPSDEPFGIAHSNWSFPALSRTDLIEEARSLVEVIDERGLDDIGEVDAVLNDYIRRLKHLHGQTIPNLWSNAAQGVPAYLLTLQGLRKALVPALRRDEHLEAASTLRKLATHLRGMEARLKGLEPRTATLTEMVERIEKAYNAADQLPADLELLSEARHKVGELLGEAVTDQRRLVGFMGEAETKIGELEAFSTSAAAVLERCEQAYSASTSVGLAAAFNERSDALSRSMWFWVAGLVVALTLGSYFGTSQLHSLTESFKIPNVAPSVIVLNLLLSLLSVAAPIWFAWLATKQIGQRFRLAEDYAFKASISRAYEGRPQVGSATPSTL